MPFSGAGVYTPPAADFPVVTQTVISSTHFNNTINDIATALSTCLTKDGQQTATANINFGGFRATNVGITAIAGSVGTPAINVSDTGTGLYRSAASELAVTVAGTQRARFDGTGLIVTGVGTFSGATSTTTLTASTSVVTPILNSPTGITFQVNAGTPVWALSTNVSGDLSPTTDNSFPAGQPTKRISAIFTPIIDSGTTGSLSLKTNNGETTATFERNGVTANNYRFLSAPAASNPLLVLTGTDTDVGWDLRSKGAGSYNFFSNNGGAQQFQILHTASATRNITVTGSNGGNPTLSTTAGSLAITPAVVIAGASLQVGTTPATTANAIGVPYNGNIASRNQANSSDIVLIAAVTLSAVNNIIDIGETTSAGVVADARSKAGVPSTTDIPAGQWSVWRDTSGATTKLYYNNAGAIQSVALA